MKIKFWVMSIVMSSVISINLLHADEMVLSSSLGVSSGYSFVSGYYSGKLSPGPSISFYYIPFIGNIFMSEFDVSWTRSVLSKSNNSALSSASVAAGPVIYYSIFSGIDFYAGTMFKGSFLFLHAEKTGEDSRTFKPGFNFLAGFYVDIPFSLRVRTGYTFSQLDLSERSFISHEISAGVSFCFYSNSSLNTEIKKIRTLYINAVSVFDSGDFNKAQGLFDNILEIDREHSGSLRYLKIINDSVNELKAAQNDIKNGKKISAIEHLENTHPSMVEAKKLLEKTRKELSSERNDLEDKIKAAYKKNNYEICLRWLERLKKIDPENKILRIYLPRTKKRINTLKKFQ